MVIRTQDSGGFRAFEPSSNRLLELTASREQKQHTIWCAVFVLNRQFLILPGRFQPSTFSVCELNYCVRDGNRWTLAAIITGLVELRHIYHFS